MWSVSKYFLGKHCVIIFFSLGKNGINLVIVSLISFTARYSFSPFSSYPLFTFFGIKVIVPRYGSEHYLVQSPLHSSWVWKDSGISVLGNAIISTVSSGNPFNSCTPYLTMNSVSFFLAHLFLYLSEGVQPMLSLSKIIISF